MKIGLYGGSFNPVHNGHIAVAEALCSAFGLDCVLMMVAKDPPHKHIDSNVPAETRLSMTELALKGIKGISASALELEREGKSYTIDTLRALKRIFAGAELYCIVGADMLIDLPNWHEAESLMRETAFIAAGREGVPEDISAKAAELREKYGAEIHLSSFVGPEISSTEIRERIYDALPVSELTPPEVEAYIYENGLYLPPDFVKLQEKIKASLKKERYIHTMGTVRCAIELADRYGENTKKARLAALLHDCAKLSEEEQCRKADEYGLKLDALKDVSMSIIHGPLGAAVAEREYGISDGELLSAIYWHTLCREDMTRLEKIIYLADKIEPGRNYEGVEEIRAAAESSLDEGVLACMERSIEYVRSSGKKLHPNVISARESILKKRALRAEK